VFIPVFRYVKVIKIHQDFPELRLQMYCYLFYGSQCIYGTCIYPVTRFILIPVLLFLFCHSHRNQTVSFWNEHFIALVSTCMLMKYLYYFGICWRSATAWWRMNVVEETDSTHRGNDTEQKLNNNRSNEFSFKIKRLARQLHVAVPTFCSSVFFYFR